MNKIIIIAAGASSRFWPLSTQSHKTLVKEEKILTSLTSFGSVMGTGVRVGINSSIMPCVKLGSNAHIWPASLVLKDVLDNGVFK